MTCQSTEPNILLVYYPEIKVLIDRQVTKLQHTKGQNWDLRHKSVSFSIKGHKIDTRIPCWMRHFTEIKRVEPNTMLPQIQNVAHLCLRNTASSETLISRGLTKPPSLLSILSELYVQHMGSRSKHMP